MLARTQRSVVHMTPFFRGLSEGRASVGYDFRLHGGASIGTGCTLLSILGKGDFEDKCVGC